MNHEHTHAKTPRTVRVAGIIMTGLVLGLVAHNLSATQAKDSTAARLQAVEDRLAIEQLLLGDYSKHHLLLLRPSISVQLHSQDRFRIERSPFLV